MTSSVWRVVAAATVAFVWGCGGEADEDGLHGSLIGRTFLSESIEGWQQVAGTEVRLRFDEHTLYANAGCNPIDAQYQIDGVTLEIAGYGMTDMGCDPALHAQDDWLGAFLLARPTLALAEPRLEMTTADARMTLLDREVASPDRPLVGTQWIGDGYGDGSSVSSLSASVSIGFDPGGSVAVHTGCQVGAGSYQVDGATITFNGLTYDGGACEEPWLQNDSDRIRLFLDGAPVTYAIEEVRLELRKGDGYLFFRAPKQ